MKIRKIVTAGTLAITVSAGALALAATPVPASTRPVVVHACGMAGNWNCPEVRPAEIGFGSRG